MATAVERCGKSRRATLVPLTACSACSGDYEDPDRSAWRETPDGQEGEPDRGETAYKEERCEIQP